MHKIHIKTPMHTLQNQFARYLGIFVSKNLYSSEIVPATIIHCISVAIIELNIYMYDVKKSPVTDQRNLLQA